LNKNSMTLFLPRKPDEYFLPDTDDGSWAFQSQLEEQEYYEHSNTSTN
jgi:hypothetical protein